MEYPHSGLSHPPPGVWCAERVHQHQPLSVWHSGDASGFLPLPPVPSAPAGPCDRRHSRFSSTAYGPHTGHCSLHSSVRLHTSVWPETPLGSDSVHLTVVSNASKAFCAKAGTFLPPTKGSNCGSASVAPETRLFQPLLPCTKVGRQSTTHSGPASSEPLPLQREVQDVDVEDYYVPDSSGRLDCHCRPEGCLFSHSGCPVAQEVPSVCFWRKGLPVQGSSLWHGLGAEDFHKCMDAALAPLRLQGIRVLNYLDDWLILDHSRVLVCYHRDIVLHHIHALGLRTNTKNSVLTTSRQTVFLGIYLDSVQMQACLAPARFSSFNACLAHFKLGNHVSVSTFRILLGLMAAASSVLPLGLLHMRPFLWWMRLLGIRSTGTAIRLIRVLRNCCRSLLIWWDPTFLQSRVRLGVIPHRHMVTTDASMTGT